MSRLNSDEKKAALKFLSPSIALYSLYVIFPIFFTFYLSFTDWDGISFNLAPLCYMSEISCFENYLEMLSDDVFWGSLKNNVLWLLFFGFSPILGLGLALFFHRSGKFASLFKSLIYAPMVFSLVVVGLIWGWFLQPEFGLVEFVLHKYGFLAAGESFGMMSSFHWATAGLIIAASWPHAAYCMVLYLAGLSNLNPAVIEASRIDGASGWKMLWHVVLPLLKPAHIIVVMVTLIGSLRTFELVAIMTGGGPANSSNVLANYMYEQTFLNFRYGYGAALAVVLFLISLGLLGIYFIQARQRH